MIEIEKNWNINQRVSPRIAFVFLLLLSFAVAWYTVITGEKVANKAKETIVLDIENRTKGYLPPTPPPNSEKIDDPRKELYK